jgi:uncharacterized protein
MTLKRILRVTGILVCLFAVAGAVIVETTFPYYGIKPFRRNWEGTPPASAIAFALQTPDSLTLQGSILPAADTAKGSLILLHGISACKEQFWSFAQTISQLGCNAVLIDLRAHGQSEGEFCTFGAKEKYDIAALVSEMEKRGLAKPYGIFGNSLGGAIALQTLAQDQRLSFGIIESTFDTYPHVALEYGADIVQFRSEWLTNHVIAKSGALAGFDPFSVAPVEACKSITCPILMAHGTADEKIPFAFGQRNFEALASRDKRFIPIEGGGHSRLFRQVENHWPDSIRAFITRNISTR